jgi:hypothetical protein
MLRIRQFYELIRQHWIITILIGVGAAISFVSTLLGRFGLSAYFYSILAGLFSVVAAIFCFWVASDPKEPRTDESGFKLPDEPIFSARMKRTAPIVGCMLLIFGFIAGYFFRPTSASSIDAVETLLTTLSSARTSLKNNRTGYEIYQRYQSARREDGPKFWNNVTLAMQIPVREVANHNSLLISSIHGPIVPNSLCAEKGAAPSADCGWVDDNETRAALKLLIEHLLRADQARNRIQELELNQSLEVFENAKTLNEEVCRYYELVLLEGPTYLTSNGSSETVYAAEEKVRKWIESQK